VPITPDEYRLAATEALLAADAAHESQRFVASHYLSGVSVECILRAYRGRVNATFDGRHYLPRLAEEGKFFRIVTRKYKSRFTIQFNDLVRRWHNDHRYYPPRKLEEHLVRLQVAAGTRNRLELNSSDMIEFAHDVVGLESSKWQ
jgi:hypothetical protein